MSLLQTVKLRPRKKKDVSEVSGLIPDQTSTFISFSKPMMTTWTENRPHLPPVRAFFTQVHRGAGLPWLGAVSMLPQLELALLPSIPTQPGKPAVFPRQGQPVLSGKMY